MGSSESNLVNMGYRVLDVQPNSPAELAGLREQLDFIISINGTPITMSDTPFQELVR
jgi:S1-C subfamily serine protease